jgi:hypothetical protein
MLEKMLGVTLVTKLRAILLMEADFNATNKIIYGNRKSKGARPHARRNIQQAKQDGRRWETEQDTILQPRKTSKSPRGNRTSRGIELLQ